MQEENTRADIPPCIKRFSHSDMKVFDCRGSNNVCRSRALVSATLQIDRCMRGAGKDNGGDVWNQSTSRGSLHMSQT